MMFCAITALIGVMETKHMLTLEQVGWYEAPPGRVTPRVIPSGFQLIEVITGGQVRFLFNGIDHLCTCGSIFWHIPGERTVHRSNPADPYRCATFLFRCSAADERPVSRFSIWPEPAEAVRFCREALQASHTDGVDYTLLGDYCRTVLHWKACSWAAANARVKVPEKLAALFSYLDRADLREVTVTAMADAAGISVSYLHQLFREHEGTTPYRCVLNRKLNKAKLLLASTTRQIKSVAFLCGFGSAESFTRSFQSHTGMSPAEYRRQRGPYSQL